MNGICVCEMFDTNEFVFLGHLLIQRVYNNLSNSIGLQMCIEEINGNNDGFEETRDDLIAYLVQTYCLMRGKDFCRYIMVTNFLTLEKVSGLLWQCSPIKIHTVKNLSYLTR